MIFSIWEDKKMVYASDEAMRRAVREICNVEVYKKPKEDTGNTHGLETKPNSMALPENGINKKTGISAGRAPGAKGAQAAY